MRRFRRSKKANIKLLLIAGICLLAVGFAGVSTTLLLEGKLSVTTNNLDVKFTYAGASKDSTAEIKNDGKKIEFHGKN